MNGDNENTQIVVDANIAIKWVLPEPLHEKAKMLLKFCSESAILMIAPAFFLAEVDSILRKKGRLLLRI